MGHTIYDHLDQGDWFMYVDRKSDQVYMKTNPVEGCFSCVNVVTGQVSPISWDAKVVHVDQPKIYLPDWE